MPSACLIKDENIHTLFFNDHISQKGDIIFSDLLDCPEALRFLNPSCPDPEFVAFLKRTSCMLSIGVSRPMKSSSAALLADR